MLCFIALSVILPNLKNSDQPNPATRMFNKSYNQVFGIGEEKYEEHKKKYLIKYIYFHMITMAIIFYH